MTSEQWILTWRFNATGRGLIHVKALNLQFKIVMKRNSRVIKMLTLFISLWAAFSSCIFEGERECPDMPAVTVKPDWSMAPGSDPEGMAYLFFPDDGTEVWRFDFPGRDAGRVSFRTGRYQFLSFNDDTYSVLFRGDRRYDTYEAYTADKEVPVSTGEKCVATPDMMWGCASDGLILGYDGLRYNPTPSAEAEDKWILSSDFILTAKQRRITSRYRYRIGEVENLAGVKSMSGALTGMAGSVMLASGVRGDYPSTLAVKAAAADSTTIAGEFYTFGIPQVPAADNILNLYVVLKDGRHFCYRFDVTEQVRAASDPLDVMLTVSGLKLEQSEGSEGTGFDVNVDGWEIVIVNIKG